MSGLLGLGGIWGISRLVTTASTGLRAARGLGLSYGEQKAFETDFGRFVEPGQFLSGVNEALHDVSKRVALGAAGLTPQEMAGDTGEVGAALLRHLKQIADQTPEAMLAQVLRARHLDQFMSLQDFERLKHTPAGEINEAARRYEADRRGLDVPQAQLKAWQDLQVTLERSKNKIENAFIKGLDHAAGPLSHLSDAFADLVSSALGSGTFKEWVDDAADGIEWFAHYVGSDQLKKDADDFADKVGKMAKAIEDALHWILGDDPAAVPPGDTKEHQRIARQWFKEHPIPNDGGFGINPEAPHADRTPDQDGQTPYPGLPAPTLGGKPWYRSPYMPWNWHWPGSSDAPTADPTFIPSAYRSPLDRYSAPISPAIYRTPSQNGLPPWEAPQNAPYTPPTIWGGSPSDRASFGGLERQYGLPNGILASLYQVESSSGRDLSTSSAGAMGPFQFMPGTWRDYGRGGDVMNLRDASDAAARYYRDLLAEFHGDVAEAAAAYNWGPANVERDVRQYGADWRRHLPHETERYVEKVLALMAAAAKQNKYRPQPNVTITNRTGGSAVISSGQLMPA